jgi:hypothetical protein
VFRCRRCGLALPKCTAAVFGIAGQVIVGPGSSGGQVVFPPKRCAVSTKEEEEECREMKVEVEEEEGEREGGGGGRKEGHQMQSKKGREKDGCARESRSDFTQRGLGAWVGRRVAS